MSKYRKLLAALGAVLAIVAKALADGAVDWAEAQEIAIVAVSAFFVYRLPNES